MRARGLSSPDRADAVIGAAVQGLPGSLVQPATLIPDHNTEPDSAADAYCLAVAIAVTVTASLAYFDAGA